MDIRQAAAAMEQGKAVRRRGWGDRVKLVAGNGRVEQQVDDKYAPAILSPADLTATDWEIDLELVGFSRAFAAMQSGHRVARRKWMNEHPGLWLVIPTPGGREVVKSYPSGDAFGTRISVDWIPVTADLFAEDWVVLG